MGIMNYYFYNLTYREMAIFFSNFIHVGGEEIQPNISFLANQTDK